jgi:hypothetical protein
MSKPLIILLRDFLNSQPTAIPTYPATQQDLKDAERVLGFKIPETLREIYLTIGNGGFGPGTCAKIVGVGESGYAPPGSATLPKLYDDMKISAEGFGLQWPDALLPYCEWGAAICSCVDCSESTYPVYLSRNADHERQPYNIDDFVRMWIEGVDILARDPRPKERAEIINPFTRQKQVIWFTPTRANPPRED